MNKNWNKDRIGYSRIKESIEIGIKKEARIPESKERDSSSLRSVRSHEHLNNIRRLPKILDVRIQGHQKQPNECIRKEGVLVHLNSVYKR